MLYLAGTVLLAATCVLGKKHSVSNNTYRLEALDLTKRVDDKTYAHRVRELQLDLNDAHAAAVAADLGW